MAASARRSASCPGSPCSAGAVPPPRAARDHQVKWLGLHAGGRVRRPSRQAPRRPPDDAGEPTSSIADDGAVTGGERQGILLVPDEDHEGERAQLVVVAQPTARSSCSARSTVGRNR